MTPMCIFHWTPKIIAHLAEHGVAPDEFEEAFLNGEDVEDPRGKHEARIGEAGGRLLYCAYEHIDLFDIIPVTAYDIGE